MDAVAGVEMLVDAHLLSTWAECAIRWRRGRTWNSANWRFFIAKKYIIFYQNQSDSTETSKIATLGDCDWKIIRLTEIKKPHHIAVGAEIYPKNEIFGVNLRSYSYKVQLTYGTETFVINRPTVDYLKLSIMFSSCWATMTSIKSSIAA